MWCLVIITLFLTFFSLYVVKKMSRIERLSSSIPGPRSFPLIGSALEFGTKPDELLEKLTNLCKKYGTVGKAWIGFELFIILSSAEDIEQLLSNSRIINKSFFYKFFHSWVGESLFTAPGEAWRKRRKLLTPAFHFKILEQFIEYFNKNTSVLVEKLNELVDKPGFDVENYISLCTLDIIGETAMGVKLNAQRHESSPLVVGIHKLSFMVVYRSFKPWLHVEWIYRLLESGRNYYANLKIVHDFVDEVIASRKQKRLLQKQTNTESTTESSELGNKKKSAFLDLLLDFAEDGGLTDEEIKYEVSSFMFGGHHTVTSGISFTMYGLMKNPGYQEKVLDELNEIFGVSGRMPNYNDLLNMKYLEKVIKESLRMWPTVPYIGRTVSEDVALRSGHVLPKGSNVVLFFKLLHYDPKSFPNPDIFDPERFSMENSRTRNPYAYCPFSAGSRNCIGQKFSMLEMKAVLSTIVRNFKIVPPIGMPDVNLSAELVLRSTTGINMRLVKRH